MVMHQESSGSSGEALEGGSTPDSVPCFTHLFYKYLVSLSMHQPQRQVLGLQKQMNHVLCPLWVSVLWGRCTKIIMTECCKLQGRNKSQEDTVQNMLKSAEKGMQSLKTLKLGAKRRKSFEERNEDQNITFSFTVAHIQNCVSKDTQLRGKGRVAITATHSISAFSGDTGLL